MSETLKVWLADDDPSIRWVLEKACTEAGMHVRAFEDGDTLLAALNGADDPPADQPDVLLTDIRMPGVTGLDLLAILGRERPGLPIIVTTAYADLDSAVTAYGGGAFEYLPKPFDVDEAVALVHRAAADNDGEPPREDLRASMPELIGQAPAMQEVFRAIGRLARSSMTVLITGQSGTGKELVAKALHRHSPRAGQAFVALNTSAIPAELLESELFGHEKGAFTGATGQHHGRFEQANSGTLFLDEIGDMSPALQTRLLRVLAEGEFYRVGGKQTVKVDVRVLAATNKDLARLVEEGSFREDLFHRLNVIHVRVPALNERREDIPALFDHYLPATARELGVPAKHLSSAAGRLLERFAWPGNVRQLINTCRLLTVTAPGREIRSSDIPENLGGLQSKPGDDQWKDALAGWARRELASSSKPLMDIAIPEVEKILIREALVRAGGRRGEAAKLLGWGRNTLSRRIKELKLGAKKY
ncbi:MAG: nitrogen regulation protein NR(I) [Gammaproteobacteria bacterium]|nr:nitrogen regulation protein NR(I) [Gammaproteobacteria bacterium]